jgi:Flp pilus assembly protein TadG
MLRATRPNRSKVRASRFFSLGREDGTQLVELAVTLPLLVVMVVGIFDFGAAFNLKQKLNNVTREAARFGSSQPTSDLTAAGTPPSVTAIRDLVDSYLTAAKVNDCGLATQAATHPSTLTWKYTTGTGCPANLVLTIDRGNGSFQATGTGASGPIYLISTHVTISYPYKWQFNRVIGLLAPGASYAGVSQIVTDAVVPNMD